jgi:hypothetical protein
MGAPPHRAFCCRFFIAGHAHLPGWISLVDRITRNDAISISPSGRVRLGPASGRGVVVPCAVVVQAVGDVAGSGVATGRVVAALEGERVVGRAVCRAGADRGGVGVLAVWSVADGLGEFSAAVEKADDVALGVVDGL